MAAGKIMTARMFSCYKPCTWNQLPDDKLSPNNFHIQVQTKTICLNVHSLTINQTTVQCLLFHLFILLSFYMVSFHSKIVYLIILIQGVKLKHTLHCQKYWVTPF